MHSVPSGSYQRFSSLPALWRAYLACRRGKRRRLRVRQAAQCGDEALLRSLYSYRGLLLF
jgi:hypothetical protein